MTSEIPQGTQPPQSSVTGPAGAPQGQGGKAAEEEIQAQQAKAAQAKAAQAKAAEDDDDDKGDERDPLTVAIGTGPVRLKLAHPLRADRAQQIGLGDGTEDLQVGQVIKVDRERGRQFINGGLVQTDPEDREAVRKALRLDSVVHAQVPQGSIG